MAIKLEHMQRIVVAVDPATTSGDDADETGIIVVASGPHIELKHAQNVCRIAKCKKHGYVLDDRSGKYTPDQWAHVVTEAYHQWKADRIVAEGNQGGEMVETVMRTVFQAAPFKRVHARQGKRTRAEPIAALYEQGRVHHCGSFAKLEDQLTTWTPDSGESPDRLDALVWGLTELGLAKGNSGGKDWLESLSSTCTSCSQVNPVGATHCSRCQSPLEIIDAEIVSDALPPTPFSLGSGFARENPSTVAHNERVMEAIQLYGPQQDNPFGRFGR